MNQEGKVPILVTIFYLCKIIDWFESYSKKEFKGVLVQIS